MTAFGHRRSVGAPARLNDDPPLEHRSLAEGVVYVNGSRLHEPHLDPERDTRSFPKRTIPAGMLYVLGDNRAHSGDSRFEPPEGVGLVPIDKVIGKAFVKVWPPGRWGWL